MSERDHFTCPNGHRVDRIRTMNCSVPGCQASVVYEPNAVGLALAVRVRHLENELARERLARRAVDRALRDALQRLRADD